MGVTADNGDNDNDNDDDDDDDDAAAAAVCLAAEVATFLKCTLGMMLLPQVILLLQERWAEWKEDPMVPWYGPSIRNPLLRKPLYHKRRLLQCTYDTRALTSRDLNGNLKSGSSTI